MARRLAIHSRNRTRLAMGRPQIVFALALLGLVGEQAPSQLRAADEPRARATPSSGPSIAALEAKINRLRENKEIEADKRVELIETITKTIEQIRSTDEFAAKGGEWSKVAESAPAEIEKVKAELANGASSPPESAPAASGLIGDLTRMQQALARAEADRDRRQQELAELNDESDRRGERRQEIAGRDEEIEKELREVEEALDRDADEDDELAQAKQTLLQSRRRALLQEQEMQRQELLAFEATAELVSAQRDLVATRLQAAEELLDAWQKAVNDFRRSEADRLYAEAQQRVAQVHPALRAIAEGNAELAGTRREMAERIEATVADSEAAEARLVELREQFEKVTERARRIGFNEAVGLLLRKHRDTLAVVDESLRNKRTRAASVSQMSVLLTDYEEQRSRLADLNSRTKIEMSRLRSEIGPADVEKAGNELRELLETQRRSLDSLIRDTTRYVEELMELESVERQLVAAVREFAAFSDEHILWIRSTGVPNTADGRRLADATGWLIRPAHWQKAGVALGRDASGHRAAYAGAGLLFVGLAAGPWLIRRRRCLRQKGPGSANKRAVPSALFAMAGDLMGAARWPLVAGFIGYRLLLAANGIEFLNVLGRSLSTIAAPWFVAGALCRIVTRHELAVHFLGWNERVTRVRRRALRVGLSVSLPLAFVVIVSETQLTDSQRNTLGRLAFLGLMGCAVILARRLFRRDAAGETVRGGNRSSGWSRTIAAARFIAVALPICLAIASLAGYHYTALQFALRSVETAAFAAGLLILHAGIARWAGLTRRRSAPELDAEMTGVNPIIEAQESRDGRTSDADDRSAPRILWSAQVQRLVRLGGLVILLGGTLWIWSSVIPVVRLLHTVAVWPMPVRLVDPDLPADEALKLITLAGLLSAIGVAAVTLVAARNVRGALELTLLKHVRLDAGARYAVAAIGRYLIGIAGLFGACSCLGIGASQLNWLVAAMTVGLGFGLQEIFANFVSGLILLFERPVRIGDIVSVEGVTGTVSRIRIRATTITDGDMRELIVPNKELITGRVINWTLSKSVARMTISVRTAHGVDPDKVRNLLLAVATQHPLVLRQPGPQALFDEFSDKTQNFTLRVYMANCDVYPQLRHELLTGIQRSFRQAGIGVNSSDAASFPVPVASPLPVAPPEQKAA